MTRLAYRSDGRLLSSTRVLCVTVVWQVVQSGFSFRCTRWRTAQRLRMRTADPSESLCGLRTSIAFVADAPDLVTAVVGNQDAAVSHLRSATGRPKPHAYPAQASNPSEMARLIRRGLPFLNEERQSPGPRASSGSSCRARRETRRLDTRPETAAGVEKKNPGWLRARAELGPARWFCHQIGFSPFLRIFMRADVA